MTARFGGSYSDPDPLTLHTDASNANDVNVSPVTIVILALLYVMNVAISPNFPR